MKLLRSLARLPTRAPSRSIVTSPPPLRPLRLFEMSPRDGLQGERTAVPTEVKVELIERLASAGLTHIESTSFVSAKAIPQLGDAADVMRRLTRREGVVYSALVPNLRGFEAALAVGVSEVAIFASASDAFSQRNINCNVQTSLERFKPVMAAAAEARVRVRGYVSCALGCPFSGPVDPHAVAFVTQSLLDLGAYEVSIADTIGVGSPPGVRALLRAFAEHGIPTSRIAVHFHATYGLALANIVAALNAGVRTVDASVAGLGGCPFAHGASGNVATEDVLYLAGGLGIPTEGNPHLDDLVRTGSWICDAMTGKGNAPRENRSAVATARLAHLNALAAAQLAANASGATDEARAAAADKDKLARIGLAWPAAPTPLP